MAVIFQTAIVGFVAMSLAAACKGEKGKAAQSAAPVVVAPVQVRDVPIIQEWAAQTLGATDVEIRARVRGFLTERAYQEGTLVRRGAAFPIVADHRVVAVEPDRVPESASQGSRRGDP